MSGELEKISQNVSTRERPKNISEKQAIVAELLATQDLHKMTYQEIAEKVGVHERTIYRWKQKKEFIDYQIEIADELMREFYVESMALLRSTLRNTRNEKTILKGIELVMKQQGKLKDTTEHNVNIKQVQSIDELEREIIELEAEFEELDEPNNDKG